MQRREFIQLAGSAVALAALPGIASGDQTTPASAVAQSSPLERGYVLPTRGPRQSSALPINAGAEGMRYRTPFRFGMGGTQIGNIFAPISDDQAQAILNQAWEAGVRYFDTSPFYGYGLSEHRLGQFLRRKPRHEYLVSTKVGRVFKPSPGTKVDDALWTEPLPFRYEYDYTAAGTRRSVEDSLQRLGLAKIDIVYIHDLGPDNTELPGTWQKNYEIATRGAMAELTKMREEGLIGAWGFGINAPDAAVLAAQSSVPTPDIVLLACQYSIIDHAFAVEKTFPALARKGVSVVVGTPLNDGFLGGRNRYNFSTKLPDGVLEKRARLTTVCDRFGIDIRTAALQFAAAPKIVSAIIPGARVPGQVKANAESMSVKVPQEFWETLRREKLILSSAESPA